MTKTMLMLAALTPPIPALAQTTSGGQGGGYGATGPAEVVFEGGKAPDFSAKVKRDKLVKPVQGMFADADANRDGAVTLAELQSVLVGRRDGAIRTRFERIDANRDRMIDQGEFMAWQTGLGTRAASEDGAAGDRGGPVPEYILPLTGNNDEGRMLRRIVAPINATLVAQADGNYDGSLSLSELLAYEQRRFDDADIDKNGEISAYELRELEAKDRAR